MLLKWNIFIKGSEKDLICWTDKLKKLISREIFAERPREHCAYGKWDIVKITWNQRISKKDFFATFTTRVKVVCFVYFLQKKLKQCFFFLVTTAIYWICYIHIWILERKGPKVTNDNHKRSKKLCNGSNQKVRSFGSNSFFLF